MAGSQAARNQAYRDADLLEREAAEYERLRDREGCDVLRLIYDGRAEGLREGAEALRRAAP